MTTMIAAYNSEGLIGRCDAHCYDAKHPDCTCICGGANHGKGQKQAMENTEALAEKWMEEYGKLHPDVDRYTIPARKAIRPENSKQLALPI
ncbi:MAG: hypothetical protein BroJett011_62110 [Chloroflexota bacterium]|nr:MAG: hypothetical protein BroJett011_62110 [Chloroflexota bacterium]